MDLTDKMLLLIGCEGRDSIPLSQLEIQLVCLSLSDTERQWIHSKFLFTLTKNKMTECTFFWPSFSFELWRSLSFSGLGNLPLLNFSLLTPSIPQVHILITFRPLQRR